MAIEIPEKSWELSHYEIHRKAQSLITSATTKIAVSSKVNICIRILFWWMNEWMNDKNLGSIKFFVFLVSTFWSSMSNLPGFIEHYYDNQGMFT